MNRIIVFGSRTWTNVLLVQATLSTLLIHHAPGDLLIVHGACYPKPIDGVRPLQSADYLAELWAQANGVKTEPHPAKWYDAAGNLDYAAGPARNDYMCKLGADLAIGFRGVGESRGTDGMRKLCERYNIPGHMISLSQWGV